MEFKNRFQSALKGVLDVDFLYSQILIPVGALAVYCVSLMFFLPEGVNKVFVARSGKLFLALAALVFIISLGIIIVKKKRFRPFGYEGEKFQSSDLILLLLPLTPIVQYLINNLDILSWIDAAILIFIFLILASLLIFVIPLVFAKTGAARSLSLMGLGFAFLIFNMASMTGQFKWFGQGSLKIQLLVLAGIWLISWIMYRTNLRSLLYLLIVFNFLSNSILQLTNRDIAFSPSNMDQNENPLLVMTESREPVITPSIYLLIYDSYVVHDIMSAHGIDNLQQEGYLEELGFKIYPRTYTLWSNSIGSMGRVLNNSTSYYGNKRRAVSGDGVVQNVLKNYGYETFGVFSWDYFSRGIPPSYDYNFPDSSSIVGLLVKAIFLGELRFDLEFEKITQEEYIEQKKLVLSQAVETPRFIYMHSLMPGHSQNSGACRPNEIELFADRVASANIEMRQDISLILENDPDSIIIVAGDHGPCLTKNCKTDTQDEYDISEIDRVDIQNRFGTFLAIKWPTTGFEEYDEIIILQDIFPVVFAYLFEDQQLLEARLEPTTDKTALSGIEISNGMIIGGADDGEPLFP